ncbi:MAG TPA: cbb3-type cytochrome c oxidase subunit II [Bryobacteraceae bacterium]|nr:cbb3-type cytochrome c oxidase subunit II [Bryobacteraceae bacterium]
MKRFLQMSYLAAFVGGVGFFAMSVLLLGVWPGRTLDRQIRAMSPEHPLSLTASEQRGREIYAREGCAYCHTQQIRYLPADVSRFGAATLAWETKFDYPHLWGTRRIGPDLSREGSTRTEDWQLAHLYAPREVVEESVMPSYSWLFDGAADRPRQGAWDLVAYLETLGRNRALAGPEGDAKALAACDCSDDERRYGFASTLNASPAMARRGGDHPVLAPSSDPARGKALYARHCASCHEARGETGLHPRPANLAEHEFTLDRLSEVLWNGLAGTAMPAWRDLPVEDVSAIAQFVRGLHQREGEPPNGDPEIGARVYAEHCVQCHGEHGAGDGPAAGRFAISPADFQGQRPSSVIALRVVKNGIEGSPMPAFDKKLTEAEEFAVVVFVRRLYRDQ